jgi:hypothetical protein
MAPEELARSIEDSIRQSPPAIVMRPRPRTHGGLVVFTLPVILFQAMASLTLPERMVWLAWIWGIAFLASVIRGRRIIA